MNKWVKRAVVAGVAFSGAAALAAWDSSKLSVTKLEYTLPRGLEELDGYTIVQLSDLHNKWFGAGQERLLRLVAEQSPDLIFMTGDFAGRHNSDLEPIISLAYGVSALAPTCYVTGNHEADLPEALLEELLEELEMAGIFLLDDSSQRFECADGAIIMVRGVSADSQKQGIQPIPFFDGGTLNILLAHRPEFIEEYADLGAHLVFSGHAHGGQLRLPLVGGAFSPGQGFFPHFTQGMYEVGRTTLVVSRGLGNNAFVPRVNNRPDVVVMTLRKEH